MQETQSIILERIIWWLIFILPATVYPLICWTYWRIINNKRQTIRNLFGSQEKQKFYINAYAPGQTQKEPFESLFEVTYHRTSYIIAIAINVVVVIIAIELGLVRAHLPNILPIELASKFQKMPFAVFAGISGAYIWGLYEILRRYRTADLTTISLHFVWMRMLLAAILGALFAATTKEPIDLMIAFGMGALPIRELMGFLTNRARKYFEIGDSKTQAEPPSLHRLQGLDRVIIDRLDDEGITSVQHLAYFDPIKLLLRTNFEWKIILDFVDQAILYSYVRDKIDLLRPIGIRGAIEMGELKYYFNKKNLKSKEDATKLLDAVAKNLGEDTLCLENLINTIYDDLHVKFLRELWKEANPENKKNDKSGEIKNDSLQDVSEVVQTEP